MATNYNTTTGTMGTIPDFTSPTSVGMEWQQNQQYQSLMDATVPLPPTTVPVVNPPLMNQTQQMNTVPVVNTTQPAVNTATVAPVAVVPDVTAVSPTAVAPVQTDPLDVMPKMPNENITTATTPTNSILNSMDVSFTSAVESQMNLDLDFLGAVQSGDPAVYSVLGSDQDALNTLDTSLDVSLDTTVDATGGLLDIGIKPADGGISTLGAIGVGAGLVGAFYLGNQAIGLAEDALALQQRAYDDLVQQQKDLDAAYDSFAASTNQGR